MDKRGFDTLNNALRSGEYITWNIAIDDEEAAFADGREVRYVTARLNEGATPAGVLNTLTSFNLLHGTGEPSSRGPQLKVLGELSSSGLITFEDTQYVGPDRGPGVL